VCVLRVGGMCVRVRISFLGVRTSMHACFRGGFERFMEEGFEGIVLDETVDAGKGDEALLGTVAELALRI